MKLFGPDKSMLIEIHAIKEHPEGLMIVGSIMGAMPMKAILRPTELRAGWKLFRPKLLWRALRMMFQAKPEKGNR